MIKKDELAKVISVIEGRKWAKSVPRSKVTVNKELLEDLYLVKRLKVSEIARIIGCKSRQTVWAYVKKYGIPLRGGYPVGDFWGRDKKSLGKPYHIKRQLRENP